MRSLIIAFVFHFTLNILIFLKGWDAFKGRKIWQIALSVIFGLELLIYSIGFALFKFLPEDIVHSIRIMGTSWMFFLLYVGGFYLVIDLFYLIWKRQLLKPAKLALQRQLIKRSVFLTSALLVIGIMAYGSFQFKNPVVQQVEMHVKKPAGDFDSLRIAVAGDMHLGYMINRDYARKYVDLIMAQQPDLILFVGDIVDSHIAPLVNGKMDEELKRLDAPLGIYSCIGNHEHRFEGEEKIRWLSDAGITMLRDSAVFIDSAFYVVGRDDEIIESRLELSHLFAQQKIDLSKPVIVLNHSPSNLAEEANAGTDIALYGHTHHGQSFPGNIATEMVFEVAHGYKKKQNTHVYVTSGIGLVGPQYRVGTVSEIVVLNVKFRR